MSDFKSETYTSGSDILTGQSWEELGVIIPPNAPKDKDFSVQCPNCKAIGRKHHNAKCLSIHLGKGAGNCKKCGAKFIIPSGTIKPDIEQGINYKLPDKKNLTKLSERGLKFFTDRMISQDAVNEARIVEKDNMIAFPYLENRELVNVKYRGIDEKKWYQEGGARPIMFNYDNAKGGEYIIVTEGETDTLAIMTAGIKHVTSVNAGAPNEGDNVDKKLDCITNSFDLFEDCEKIIIATDNDVNGRRLQKDLINRFGSEKCYTVDFGKYKDANEYLMFEGKEALRELIKNPDEVKMEGVFTVSDATEELLRIYDEGLPMGTTTYFPSLDKCFTWRKGEANILTGYNNEGKTALILQLALCKAKFDGWKWAVFSPENYPLELLFEDLIHSLTGKTIDIENRNRLSRGNFIKSIEWLNRHFYSIFPEDGFSVEAILERMRYTIRKYGMDGIIIDPYNILAHDWGNQREDNYIPQFINNLKRIAVDHNVTVNLVVHQKTPQRLNEDGNYPRPHKSGVRGGNAFSDSIDNMISVWRPRMKTVPEDREVIVMTDKIKKMKLTGSIGQCSLDFDPITNRYEDTNYKTVPLNKRVENIDQIDFNDELFSDNYSTLTKL